jgi:hypothetical protein
MSQDLDTACKVVCISEENPPYTWSVFVPARLLWSAEGMAELFRVCRRQLADPAEFPDDDQVRNVWDSYHVASIEQVDGYVVDLEWQEPEKGDKHDANSAT